MPRECVRWFSRVMEERLKDNDHKLGWKGEERFYFTDKLREKISDLDYRKDCLQPAKIVEMAADIANYAMMLADNERTSKKE